MARDGKSPGRSIVFLYWLHWVCRDGVRKAKVHLRWHLQGTTSATRRASYATSVAKGWTTEVQDCCSTGGVWGGELVTAKQVRLIPTLRQSSAARSPACVLEAGAWRSRSTSNRWGSTQGTWGSLGEIDHTSWQGLTTCLIRCWETSWCPLLGWSLILRGCGGGGSPWCLETGKCWPSRKEQPASQPHFSPWQIMEWSWWSTGLGTWRRWWSKTASVDLLRITWLPVMMKWQNLWMGREQWMSFMLASCSKAGLLSWGRPRDWRKGQTRNLMKFSGANCQVLHLGMKSLELWYRLEIDWLEISSPGKALGVLEGSRQHAVHEQVACLGDKDGQQDPGLHELECSLMKGGVYAPSLSTCYTTFRVMWSVWGFLGQKR